MVAAWLGGDDHVAGVRRRGPGANGRGNRANSFLVLAYEPARDDCWEAECFH